MKFEFFPARLSSGINFNLSHNSLGSDGKNIVFDTYEAETINPGDLSIFISVRSRVDLLP